MTVQLFDVADVIRSKNSGPYELTFDVIFKEEEMFQKVQSANVFNKEMCANLYHIPLEHVMEVIYFPPAKAVKMTIVRPMCSGNLGETDVYGAQQHTPLLQFSFSL